jgi:hypothetical protein
MYPGQPERRHSSHSETVPVFALESAYDNTGTVTQLSTQSNAPATRFVFAKRVITFLPAGASGLLTLGTNVNIPVGPGLTNISLYLLLQPEDPRILTSTIAGVMSLVIMGQQLSKKMLMHSQIED